MPMLCRYHYDPLDRLASCTPLAAAMARRFYRDDQFVTELQGEEQRSLLRVPGQILAQRSQIGSALLSLDSQSSVLRASTALAQLPIAYSAYGHRQNIIDFPGLPGFDGEQPSPVTGHYLLGNGYRAYNPVLMRFNSPDSWSPFGDGGLNAYAYCVGDPVNRSDPTGHVAGWAFLRKMVTTNWKATQNRVLYTPVRTLQQRAVSALAGSSLPIDSLPPSLKQSVQSERNRPYASEFFLGLSGILKKGDYPSFDLPHFFQRLQSTNKTLIEQYPQLLGGVGDFDFANPTKVGAISDIEMHMKKNLLSLDRIRMLGGAPSSFKRHNSIPPFGPSEDAPDRMLSELRRLTKTGEKRIPAQKVSKSLAVRWK